MKALPASRIEALIDRAVVICTTTGATWRGTLQRASSEHLQIKLADGVAFVDWDVVWAIVDHGAGTDILLASQMPPDLMKN